MILYVFNSFDVFTTKLENKEKPWNEYVCSNFWLVLYIEPTIHPHSPDPGISIGYDKTVHSLIGVLSDIDRFSLSFDADPGIWTTVRPGEGGWGGE